MLFWLSQFGLAFVAVIVLGLCGYGFATHIFTHSFRKIPYWILTAPLIGILALLLAVIILYDCGLSMRLSLLTGIVVLLAYSTTCVKKSQIVHLFALKKRLFLILVASVFIVSITTHFGAFKAEAPYVWFHDGTDTLGYANNADWLKNHTVIDEPSLTAKEPYAALPSINLKKDNRLGSYVYLALTSELAQLPALFSYHLAGTIYTALAILALAASVSGNGYIFAFVFLGLISSSWYDSFFQGFLGKFLLMPAIFMLYALAVRQIFQRGSFEKYFALIVLMLGILTVYPYMAPIAIFSGGIIACLLYYGLQPLIMAGRSLRSYAATFKENKQLILLFGVLILVFFAIGGGFSNMWQQQVFGSHPSMPTHFKPWELVFSIFSMKYFSTMTVYGSARSYFDCSVLILAIIIHIAMIFVALRVAARAAFILMAGPLLIALIILGVQHNLWAADQLAIIPYFSLILGAGLLLTTLYSQDYKNKFLRLRKLTVVLIVLIILSHLAYLISIFNRDILAPPRWELYKQSEFSEVEKNIGQHPTLVSTTGIFDSQPLFLHFEPKGMPVSFAAHSWDLTNWGLPPLPVNESQMTRMIISKATAVPVGWQVIAETTHYKILARHNQINAVDSATLCIYCGS